jgi:YidC/Oxa1 family membrane protein insertase
MARQPQRSPLSGFLLISLWAITIFLGFQLFFGERNRPTEFQGQTLTTSQQALTALRDANLKVLDQSAAHRLYPALQRIADQEARENKLTAEKAEALKIEGAVLVADAQLKAGVIRNDTNRVRAAYASLANWQKSLLDKPQWNVQTELPRAEGETRFAWDAKQSGQSMYASVVNELSARNKRDLIWGFLPGGYQAIDVLVRATGSQPGFSYAFAAFLLALLVRALVWPLAQKQLMWGRQMSQLTPLTTELREKYKDNPSELQQKTFALYREYGINPMAGCFPALVQLPLFFTVYQCMLHYQFEFQKGTFLWINPDTHKALNGWVAPNLGQIDYLMIVLYGISMIVTTFLTPASDPSQIKQYRAIGVFFALFAVATMFTGWFPVPGAFVLYWFFLNVLSTIQSLRAYRLPMPALAKVNAPGGGVYPKAANGGFFQKWMEKAMEQQQQMADQNGKPSNGKAKPGSVTMNPDNPGLPGKTGTPAKHKPKKRK